MPRRYRLRRRPPPSERGGVVGDDVPRAPLYDEPIAVQSIEALPPEPVGRGLRVTFWVNVRDAAGRPCRDLAVDATISGPERAGSGMARTDEHGQVRFRMTGPAGTYRCEITDVAAGAIRVTRQDDGTVARAEVTV